MDGFRVIALTAGLISIVTVIFDTIYPSEKYSNQMRIIFSLVFVLSIAAPFMDGRVDVNDISTYADVSSSNIENIGDSTEKYFIRSIENNISRNIGAYLTENQISFKEIKTSINISSSDSISINEIEIAVNDTAREDEIIALVKSKTGQDTVIKIKECIQ